MYGILLWGGIGISLGLVCFGKRVIVTMGSKISRMTPSLGFTVVLTASIVVMICSIAGIPTSTTHCQVMGVVGAGVAKGWVDSGSFKGGLQTIDFSLMRNIALSWIVTIPFALVLSSMLYAVARVIIIGNPW
jgi:phosphate/sulfate permease